MLRRKNKNKINEVFVALEEKANKTGSNLLGVFETWNNAFNYLEEWISENYVDKIDSFDSEEVFTDDGWEYVDNIYKNGNKEDWIKLRLVQMKIQ